MFAIEISFTDGISQPEMILVRRPQALLGASDYSHVVLEDMSDIGYQVRIMRDLGTRFRCKPVGASDSTKVPSILEGVYDGETSLDLGALRLHITALDIDLALKESEPPDRAGVRVLRQVCASSPPKYPAVVVPGTDPVVVSFTPDHPVYIGRSNQCELRLDSSDLSGRHARMGYESGKFWIEDLGSTNGTFVNQQQISGRTNIDAGETILLGRETLIMGVTSEEQIARATSSAATAPQPAYIQETSYPVLVSASEVARPARVVVQPGESVKIGRDPGSDMWLGAPHISRLHLLAEMSKTGALTIADKSTNGTMYDHGRLRKGDIIEIAGQPRVFNFGGEITVGLCFNEDEESTFLASQGAANTFTASAGTQVMDAFVGGSTGRIAGFDDASGMNEATGTGTFAHAGSLYRSLKFSRKLLLVLIVVVMAMVVMVMGNLVIGLL